MFPNFCPCSRTNKLITCFLSIYLVSHRGKTTTSWLTLTGRLSAAIQQASGKHLTECCDWCRLLFDWMKICSMAVKLQSFSGPTFVAEWLQSGLLCSQQNNPVCWCHVELNYIELNGSNNNLVSEVGFNPEKCLKTDNSDKWCYR